MRELLHGGQERQIFTPANGNKGVGVRKILDYYHLDKENAIAFGDGTNDIEMLEAVGTGVAMGNATDDVKQLPMQSAGMLQKMAFIIIAKNRD